MATILARHWWSLVIRGLVAILFGLVTFAWPGITLGALVLLFGAYALVDGIVNLVAMFRSSRAREHWWAFLLEGIAGILAGLVTFLWPVITTLALVYIIAGWAFVTGIFEIIAAIRLRKHIAGEVLLVLSGILSIVLGFLFAIAPLAGALVIALWVGIYAMIFGALLVALGFRLRSWGHTHPIGSEPLPSH
jgi:uncharacterized membrane protein HdeD (DUF308 family)